MRKRIAYLAFAAALALCYSCSNDETVAVNTTPQDNEISFRPLTNGTTRAYDILNAAALTSFKVQAFLNGTASENLTDDKAYFSNVTFTGPTTYTSGETKYYWPSTNLDFYAWSVHSGSNNPTDKVTRNSYKEFAVTPGSEATAQPDLVFACSKNVAKVSTGVPLYFKHTESRILLKVKNSNPALSFKVEGWQVGGLYSTGTFTHDGNATVTGTGLIGGAWTLSDGNRSVENVSASTFASATIASNASTAAEVTGASSMILIPQGTSQSLAAATAFSTAAANAVLNGSYIAVKMSIWNSSTNWTFSYGRFSYKSFAIL